MTLLTYRYRLYPNKEQEQKLNDWLESLRLLYNFSLSERRDDYEAEGRSISVYQQKRTLPELKRRFPRYAVIHSQVLQDALSRLDRAFKRFFGRRVSALQRHGALSLFYLPAEHSVSHP